MKVSVKRNTAVNLIDILQRSDVGHIPGAEETLRSCIFRSIEVRCGMLDNKVACIWGLVPPTILSERAYLWLLTTDIVAEHKFLFVRHSQRYVEDMLKVYPEIYGEVFPNNHAGKRWLRWLGAEIGYPENGTCPFSIKRKVLNG